MNNNSRVWKAPVEVPIEEVPGRRELSGKYAAFLADAELRLSQTVKAAIMYEFPDEYTARRHGNEAASYIRKKHGHGSVRTVVRGTKLYVWRGEKW